MTIKNWISYTGIFTYPIVVFLFNLIVDGLQDTIPFSPTVKIILVYVLPILYPIIITVTNIQRQKRGQTDFSFSSVYGLGEKDPRHSKEYLDKAYPNVPKKYSSKTPKDFVFGMHKGKYVICPIDTDGCSIFCIGTPGSGKSVLLLSILYSMLFREIIAKRGREKIGKKFNFFMIDIKGELYQKLLQIDESEYTANDYKQLQVVQPSNRQAYGYDVFYRIHKENVSETEYIKAITDIAESLIPESKDDSPYFYVNARKILKGVLMYYAKLKWDFVPIIKELMRNNLDELLTRIVEDAERRNMGFVIDTLKGFVGKGDNESVGDIESTLKMYLEVFSYPDICYCLHDNPNKTSPRVLDDGVTNLDLAIEEGMLSTYGPIFRLICMQVLKHCESEFKESDERYTCLIFDEASRVGKIAHVDGSLATLRSKHTAILFFFQSISQFKTLYEQNTAQTMLNLCEVKLFLSGAGDKETTEYVSSMVGKYDITKMSYKRKGFLGGKSDGNYSQERRDVVEARDLMELRERGECMAFIYGKYFRCKKLKYYEDKFIAPILKNKK